MRSILYACIEDSGQSLILTYSSKIPKVAATGSAVSDNVTSLVLDGCGVSVSSFIVILYSLARE